MSATNNMSNVKPISSFLPHFLENIVVFCALAAVVRVLTSPIVSSNPAIRASPLRNSQKKERVGLRSGDLKGHSLMLFAVLSRKGEQDLCSILQLLHNLQSISFRTTCQRFF